MTDSTPRAWAPRGITIKVLRLLINVGRVFPDAKVEIPTACVAIGCPANTIHQAVHRLRDQGLPVETFPPGPFNQWTGGATHYRLPADAIDQALVLLRALLREKFDVTNLLGHPLEPPEPTNETT